MAQYTNQSAFDLVAAHIFNQGERAMKGAAGCCYMNKHNNQLKCAVGALLTDEECEYMDAQEQGDIASLMAELRDDDIFGFDIYKKLKGIDTDLMVDLQNIHDTAEYWEYTKSMRDEFRSLAFKHGLDVSCLEGMHFGDR